MRFRNVPNKERVSFLLPTELDEAIRAEAHRTRSSLSEVASTAIARGLGKEPAWTHQIEAQPATA